MRVIANSRLFFHVSIVLALMVLTVLTVGSSGAAATPASRCDGMSRAIENQPASGPAHGNLMSRYEKACTDPDAPDHLVASIPDQCSNCTVGGSGDTRIFPTVAFPLTVTANDRSGGVAESYTGTVSVTSSDCSISVTGGNSYTFTAGDGGTHTFSVEVSPAWQTGPCTIAVNDTSADVTGATLTPYAAGELCDGLDDNGNNVVDELYPLLGHAAILYYDYSFSPPVPVQGVVTCAPTHQGYSAYVSLL